MKIVNSVIEIIKELASKKDNLFIAIDGSGGAGKSTLMKHIKKAIPEVKFIGMETFVSSFLLVTIKVCL